MPTRFWLSAAVPLLFSEEHLRLFGGHGGVEVDDAVEDAAVVDASEHFESER